MTKIRIAVGTLLAAMILAAPRPATSTGYREAPFISQLPKLDGSDLYAFKSYQTGRGSYVTIIANYNPLQDPWAGPSYHPLDPNGLYEIHIDNIGDCKEHLTFQFRFQNALNGLTVNAGGKDVAVPLLYTGPVSAADESKLNLTESYTVKLVRGDRRSGTPGDVVDAGTGSTTFRKPLDYVGQKTLGNPASYATYANNFIYNISIPGCPITGRLFVGQRHDHADEYVGSIFDLFDSTSNFIGPPNGAVSNVRGKNVTSLALELPIPCLIDKSAPTLPSSGTVLGVWTTSSIRQARLVNPSPTFKTPDLEGGAWTQVSRVGLPLTNDLIIGVPDKDSFNASKPVNDAAFVQYVTNPTLPVLLNQQFGYGVPNTPRNDLMQVFFTGLAGVNQNGGSCEMLRLNTGVAATPKGTQNNLGSLACFGQGTAFNSANAGCDAAGFPNGRRPGDDVVDISLRLAEGALLPPDQAPSGNQPFTDGTTVNDSFFLPGFPYMPTPIQGAP